VNCRRRAILRVEELERRLAPAAFVNPTPLHFTDVDGDNVTVLLSKPLLQSTNVGTIFIFNNSFGSSGPQQLEEIDLTSLAASANGLSLTITAVPSAAGGDGFVNVGFINATGSNLGTVSLHGDLGRIDAGNSATPTTGLAALKVHSLGEFGNIFGKLGKLTVGSDIDGAFVNVEGGTAGSIGSIHVGGSLIGAALANSGSIQSTGSIGLVKIGGDVIGGADNFSGFLSSRGALGQVAIGGDVQGGGGQSSGEVAATTSLAGITVGGYLIGGSANNAGTIQCGGILGKVTVTGSVEGGGAPETGGIFAIASIAGANVGGALVGSANDQTGIIDCEGGSLGPVTIGGDVQGGTGPDSGEIISATTLAVVTIGGPLIGAGTQKHSGFIKSGGNLVGPVSIAGDVQGGGGQDSGAIISDGTLGAVTVGGSLIGGTTTALDTGLIQSGANMGPITIKGNVQGGEGNDSGSISAILGAVSAVSIGGSLIGGSANFTGVIISDHALGAVSIGGSLIGGSVSGAATLEDSGLVLGGADDSSGIASLHVGGSIIAGTNTSSATNALTGSGWVQAGTTIGPITVGGSLVGNSTNQVIISALGQTSLAKGAKLDVAIASLTVGGRVDFADILAGYNDLLEGENGQAGIGAVAVGKDWIASNLVAGASATGGGSTVSPSTSFGGSGSKDLVLKAFPSDSNLIAEIASIVIGGDVLGTVAAGDQFGFVAQEIGSFSDGGTVFKLKAGPGNDNLPVEATGDVTLQEVS